MVVKEKEALKAVHRLLIQGRRLSCEGISGQDFFTYFDDLKGLMGCIIAWQDDKSELFESGLSTVYTVAKAPYIFEEFKRS
jgi:hypothetical protein